MSAKYPPPAWIQEPPLPKGAYVQQRALDDIPGIAYALHIFLASHMLESEEYCNKSDPKKYVNVCATIRLLDLIAPPESAFTLQQGMG